MVSSNKSMKYHCSIFVFICHIRHYVSMIFISIIHFAAPERRTTSNWCSGLDYSCTQSASSSPPTPPKIEFDDVEKKSKDIFQSPSVVALGNSEALGGAAAIAAVTASAIPLIHHSIRRNSRVSASRVKDMSRCVSATSAASRQVDGDSSLTNGNSTCAFTSNIVYIYHM